MRNFIAAIAVLILCTGAQAQIPFPLQTGDLLFQVGGASAYTDAIKSATSGIRNLEFSHVGVAYEQDGQSYVLEATPYGVVKSTLSSFFNHSKTVDGNPMVVVARLKPRLRDCIPSAIEKIESLLGKRYDFLFDPDDDTYYCSELIYVSYLKPSGKPVFKAHPMTFRDKKTGEYNPYWMKHFQMHKHDIPEGVPGTNPGDMSRSGAIQIVHHYF